MALHTDEDDGAALFLYRKLSKEPMQPPMIMPCFPVDASDVEMQVSFFFAPEASEGAPYLFCSPVPTSSEYDAFTVSMVQVDGAAAPRPRQALCCLKASSLSSPGMAGGVPSQGEGGERRQRRA